MLLQEHIQSQKDGEDKSLSQLDVLEQFTRRTYIQIYDGIPVSNVVNVDGREDTDILAMNFIKEELGVDLKREDISCSYRVGKRSTKPRPIIVHLSRQNTKVEILQKRRVLKQDIKHVRRFISTPLRFSHVSE